MSERLGNVLKFLGFLGIGAVILTLVYRSQSAAYQAQCAIDGIAAEDCSLLGKLAADLGTVNYWWLLAILLIFMLSNVFRAARWVQLIEPLGQRVRFANSFWSVMIGYFANLGLPRAGEVVRAGVLGRYEGIAVEKVMGTVVVDRVLDVLCLLVVVAVAFVLQWDTLAGLVTGARGGAAVAGTAWYTYATAGLAALLAGAALAYWAYRRFSHLAIVKRLGAIVAGFGDGLRSAAGVDRKGLLLLHTAGIWTCYFAMAYLPFFAFPPTAHLGPDAALMLFVFSALGIIIPSPGGMGSYHLMVIQALALYDVSGADALSFANILFFAVNLGCNILFGLIGLAVLPTLNGGREARVEPA